MKTYVVGGAVRDALIGRPGADRDWVVVGATPEQMSALGYRPVGRDFPVFLHPVTHEEYALARTERKSGRGYRGFIVHASPEVTLEEDLLRRDLTINAMAQDETGAIVDPYGGERDLRAGLLRHVSAAFAEDPVRILRVARFAARFDFGVAPETMALMRAMVESGEADFLVPERVWQEFSRGLAEAHPQRMFEVLAACGYLAHHLPELRPDPVALGRAVASGAALEVRFAMLAWTMSPAPLAMLCERLRAPNEARELAESVIRCRGLLEAAVEADAVGLLGAIKCADALRRPERFTALLEAAQRASGDARLEQSALRLARALAAARGVDAGAVARAAGTPSAIAGAVEAARAQAIATALGTA